MKDDTQHNKVILGTKCQHLLPYLYIVAVIWHCSVCCAYVTSFASVSPLSCSERLIFTPIQVLILKINLTDESIKAVAALFYDSLLSL